MERKLLNLEECAVYLGVSKYTLYRWVNERKIPFYKCGHLLKFDLRDINAWIDKNKVKEYKF